MHPLIFMRFCAHRVPESQDFLYNRRLCLFRTQPHISLKARFGTRGNLAVTVVYVFVFKAILFSWGNDVDGIMMWWNGILRDSLELVARITWQHKRFPNSLTMVAFLGFRKRIQGVTLWIRESLRSKITFSLCEVALAGPRDLKPWERNKDNTHLSASLMWNTN